LHYFMVKPLFCSVTLLPVGSGGLNLPVSNCISMLHLPVALMALYEVSRYNSQYCDASTETDQIYH
jgi:hypothetical protein